MAFTPTILTTEDDFEEVRAKLGVDPPDFSSKRVKCEAFAGDAEEKIIEAIAVQRAEGASVRTVTQIMADVDSSDYRNLRNACKSYICKLFAPAESNAVNTALTQGSITKDLGGVGTTWIPQEKDYEKEFWDELTRLSGWQLYRLIPSS